MWTETTDRNGSQGVATISLAEDVVTARSAVRDRGPVAGDVEFEPATLHALLAQLPVAVLLVDRDGRVIYANDAAGRLQALGTLAWPDVAQLPPALEWPVARALLTGQLVRDEELTVTGVGGQGRCVGVSITPVRSAEAHGAAGVLTLVDLTDAMKWKAWAPAIESLGRL